MGADRDASRKGRGAKGRPLEAPAGRYFATPHSVLDSEAWQACSPAARALMMEVCRQHSGANNGRLHLARDWLAARGWKRPATAQKLIDELLRNRLLVMTRKGGLNRGPHWFALTWLPISDWRGLSITPQDYHPGAYLLKPIQEPEPKKSQWTPHVLGKHATRTPHVLDAAPPRTPHVLVEAVLITSPRTPHVRNECLPFPPAFPGPARMTAARLRPLPWRLT